MYQRQEYLIPFYRLNVVDAYTYNLSKNGKILLLRSSEGRDTDCPARVVYGDDYATITSTLYPYNYKLDSQCLQTFTAPPGETVSLKFEKVDVEDYQGICYYDWIKVKTVGAYLTGGLGVFLCKAMNRIHSENLRDSIMKKNTMDKMITQ